MGEIGARVRAAVEAIADASAARGLDIALRPPASVSAVEAAEEVYGQPFPEAVREFYLLADGQHERAGTMPLLGEFGIRSLRRATQTWEFTRDFIRDHIVDDPDTFERDADPEVRSEIFHDGRWPFAFWDTQSAIWLDGAPADAGRVGQLISTGSHEDANRWIAPGLLELLEAVADGIETGLVLLHHYPAATGSAWGVGPGGLSFSYYGRKLFDAPGAAPDFVADFPPEWAAWVERAGPRFAGLFGIAHGLVAVPPGTADLAPLSLLPAVRYLDLTATRLGRLEAIPDLPDLANLRARGVDDLSGIDRFPVNSLWLKQSPDVDLSVLPLTGYGSDTPLGPSAVGIALGMVDVPATTIAEAQRALDVTTSILQLDLGDSDVDVADLDWAGRTLDRIGITGGRIGSMAFAAHVRSFVTVTAATSVDLRDLPIDDEERVYSFRGVPLPAHPEALAGLRPPGGIGAPFAWWEAFGDTTDPLIWNGFPDAEEGSSEQQLGWDLARPRNEWMNDFRRRRTEELMERRRRGDVS